ncbi:hypothetical protein [Paraburkholderia saeva]|uniref:Uncharacterized protein n=1 Tax=Paraburkholderia saeva TaxID=2777537 RepID=A0A9N8RZR3_9BURK|nr:hypothetical protein [Paraburkholderia saeva]CAG4919303.1 hypothetical protein LMG31841_04864 [Paraburkholderia saeva]
MGFIDWVDIHQGTAAWIQAIGAGLAIAAAFIIPARQRHNEAAVKRVQDAERNAAIARRINALAHDYLFMLEQMGKQSGGRGNQYYRLDGLALEDLMARLRAVEGDETNALRLGMIFDLRANARTLRRHFIGQFGEPQAIGDDNLDFASLRDRARYIVGRTKEAADAAEYLAISSSGS